jgi:hypothetical protein
LIQFLGNNIYGGNNGTLNIKSRKRKSTETDEPDSTGIDESDATGTDESNATENVEDICVDGEQVVSYILLYLFYFSLFFLYCAM